MRKSFFIAIMLVGTLCLHAAPKYIFYFIGDGMGTNQVLAAEMYKAELEGKIGRVPLVMSQFPFGGLLSTFSAKNGVTDSSAAGTALACGEKAINGQLGLNAAGDTLQSIVEVLGEKGWGTGVCSSSGVDHATPASFYANCDDRGNYYEIACQLTRTDIHFFGGGDFHYTRPEGNPTAPSVYDLATENGFTIVRGVAGYQALTTAPEKLILFQDEKSGSLPHAIDHKEGLRLHEIVATGIQHLSQHERFILAIEEAEIDWAGHSDDGRTVIDEVLEMDKAINEAYQFYLQHPDETLIIVTADHETGGMIIGNGDDNIHLALLQHQKSSLGILSDKLKALYTEKGKKIQWEDVKALLTAELGLYGAVEVYADEDARLQEIFQRSKRNKDKDVETLYKTFSELSGAAVNLLNTKAGLNWMGEAHSAAPVPIFAIGAGAERFSGFHDNTEIKQIILDLVK